MPYIPKEDRTGIEKFAFALATTIRAPKQAGKMNFAITTFLDQVYSDRMLSYDDVNEIVGVLECVKQEFYRRVAAPYEDTKLKQNGEVYKWMKHYPESA